MLILKKNLFYIILIALFILGISLIFEAQSIGESSANQALYEASQGDGDGLSGDQMSSIKHLTTYTYLLMGAVFSFIGGLGIVFDISIKNFYNRKSG